MSSNAVRHRSNPASFAAGQIAMVSLEFNGPVAGEIKRHPQGEVLLVARDNRAGVMRKGLN